jgi:hypothetical protein
MTASKGGTVKPGLAHTVHTHTHTQPEDSYGASIRKKGLSKADTCSMDKDYKIVCCRDMKRSQKKCCGRL